MNAELQKTLALAKALKVFVDQFRQTITRETGEAPAVEKAADRAEEALIEMMRKATDELAAGHLGNHPNSFQCQYCAGEHHLAKDFYYFVDENDGQFQASALARKFQYTRRHADEVVRQLRLRQRDEFGSQEARNEEGPRTTSTKDTEEGLPCFQSSAVSACSVVK